MWEANLLQFYNRVWPHLAAALPTPFRLENGIRRDETPAHEALREAFVNAFIHGDYSAPGGLVVERMPNELAIENAGTMLIALEQYQRGGISECRNPGLQRMFSMIGGGEHAGSGTDKIRAGWRYQHWRAPLLTTFQEPDRVRLTLPLVSLIPEETALRLRAFFGAELDGLSPAEMQALATADLEGAVSNARLQQLLVDHPVEITRTLTSLCERGLLVSDNRRRWTTYRLSRRQMTPSLFDADAGSAGELSDLASDRHLAGTPDTWPWTPNLRRRLRTYGRLTPVSEGPTDRLRRLGFHCPASGRPGGPRISGSAGEIPDVAVGAASREPERDFAGNT